MKSCKETTTTCDGSDEESSLPITSYLCQWKAPKKRKESVLKMSDASFEKHVYGRVRKYQLKPLENFDPRPPDCVGKMKDRLPALIDKLHGRGLGISYLLDPSTCYWDTHTDTRPDSYNLPSVPELRKRVEMFKSTLKVSPEKIREIEQKTKDQHLCEERYFARRYRITASNFGTVYHRRQSTPPDGLVLRLLGVKKFAGTDATEWGKQNENQALNLYSINQKSSGHEGLITAQSGFVSCESHPFVGASPDANVYDPSNAEPFGVAEVKCPYACRNVSPAEACTEKSFSCSLDESGKQLLLKRNHNYYCQIQGQMGITGRAWCDFIVLN